MPEVFTDSERQILSRYCSSIDSPVFVLKNLPESVKGALFSRYSRSPKSLRRILLDEFLLNTELDLSALSSAPVHDSAVATQKANDFYQRVLDGYGDDSVGELGGCHVAIENISNLATKVVQDARLGGSPLEKSSRYVFFDQKIDGEYQFYKEPQIMASEFRDDYLRVNNLLFDTYSKLMQPLTTYFEQRFPIDSFSFLTDYKTREEKKFPQITDEEVIKRARGAYKASIRAKTCDVLRYFLPVSTTTNMGVFGNGRFFEYLLRKLYSSPLTEMQELAVTMRTELDSEIAPFVKRSQKDDFIFDSFAESRKKVLELTKNPSADSSSYVVLFDFDSDAEEKVLIHSLFDHSTLSLEQCRHTVSKLSHDEKGTLLKTLIGKRRTRRDKPSRAFENAYYTFDLLGDYGMYRDLHRHRVLTQSRQDITVKHGFETPLELVEAGFESDFVDAMKAASDLYYKIHPKFPLESQYVVPFAFKIRWYMTMNLREAFHFIELRSQKQGHPSYRKMTQQMYREIQKVHPRLAELMQFVDLNDYDLSRLDAEMKTLNKKAISNQ